MSVTVFVNKNKGVVNIVEWFLDTRSNIEFATGPIIKMKLNEFYREGYSFVKEHVIRYSQMRVPTAEIKNIFEDESAKKVMQGCSAVAIRVGRDGEFVFIAKEIKKFGLHFLENVGAKSILPQDSSEQLFWETFDHVLDLSETVN